MSKFLSRRLTRGFLNTTWDSVIRESNKTRFLVPTQSSSSQCLENANLRIRLAFPVDYDRVLEFMCKTYFKAEPSLVNIGLASEDHPPKPLVHLMHQQIKEGMTIIAEDTDNCVILGAAVNAGSCPWDPERMIEYAECCCQRGSIRDVIKFFAHVTREPKLWDKYGVLKIYECSYVAVDLEHLGLGIGKRLIRESWSLARQCGYHVFRIDCTSKYTVKIAEGFGWECVFSMPYRRYIDSGGLVFKCIQEPHTEVRVFVDRPLIWKDYSKAADCKIESVSKPDDCKVGTLPRGK